MQLPFHRNEKLQLLFPINEINIDDGAEARSYFGILRLYDDVVVEDCEHTTPIIHEMDDNCHSKSDNLDTQRLDLKVNLRVVSTVYPRDKTFSQLYTTSRSPMDSRATTPSPRWISTISPLSSCKGSATLCSPSATTSS